MLSVFAAALRGRAPAIMARMRATEGDAHGPCDLAPHEDASVGNTIDDIDFLLSALEFQRPALFVDYTDWQRITLKSRDVPLSCLLSAYQALRNSILDLSHMAESAPAGAILDGAIARLMSGATPSLPPASTSSESGDTAQLSARYLELLMAGKRSEATGLILSAMDAGLPVEDLYLKVLQPALREVGRLWQTGGLSVAQEHYISAVTQVLIARIYPRLPPARQNGKVLLAGCVTPNLHDIGLRFVCDLFELRGWDTNYIGANTPGKELCHMALQMKPDIVAISVSLATHLHSAAEFIRQLRDAQESQSIPVIAGGMVFLSHADLWKQIGADGFAADAQSAIEMAQQILEFR